MVKSVVRMCTKMQKNNKSKYYKDNAKLECMGHYSIVSTVHRKINAIKFLIVHEAQWG